MVHRGDVVLYLLHVLDGRPGTLFVFEKEQVGQRRLRAVDL